ncbi:MAG: hypothetical protein DMG35_10545 [Acidobacteria bacterium]|nr:MAG: hypothetical protein DMG35_10545 [Acidobacteriota bacterium]
MATPVPTRRSEKRIAKILAAELWRPDESVPQERTFTENVSPRGVRVTAVQRWQPGTRVLLTFPQNGIQSQGRIVYCQRVESGNFALGLELPWQVQRWQMLWQTSADVRLASVRNIGPTEKDSLEVHPIPGRNPGLK